MSDSYACNRQAIFIFREKQVSSTTEPTQYWSGTFTDKEQNT